VRDPTGGTAPQTANVHPSSVNSRVGAEQWSSPYLVFHERVRTSKVWLGLGLGLGLQLGLGLGLGLGFGFGFGLGLGFHERVRTSKVYLRDCSPVPPLALLLFAGGRLDVCRQQGSALLVDGWLRVGVPARAVPLLLSFRGRIDAVVGQLALHPNPP
jgi:hypothetical protein